MTFLGVLFFDHICRLFEGFKLKVVSVNNMNSWMGGVILLSAFERVLLRGHFKS